MYVHVHTEIIEASMSEPTLAVSLVQLSRIQTTMRTS